MKVVIQRSKESRVEAEGKTVGQIPFGLVLLVGFTDGDTISDLGYIAKKVLNIRIFDDENGVMNKSILDVKGSILSISQFTLYAVTKNGNRPSYGKALNSEDANALYEKFNSLLKKDVPVETGIFRTDMQVFIHNDGPVTIIIDSKEK